MPFGRVTPIAEPISRPTPSVRSVRRSERSVAPLPLRLEDEEHESEEEDPPTSSRAVQLLATHTKNHSVHTSKKSNGDMMLMLMVMVMASITMEQW